MTDEELKRVWLKSTTEKMRPEHLQAMRAAGMMMAEEVLSEMMDAASQESASCAKAHSDGQYAANRIWNAMFARRSRLEIARIAGGKKKVPKIR